MFNYWLIFLFALILSVAFGWLPYSILGPIRNFELSLLYKAYKEGPGGMDDAVQDWIAEHSVRYSEPIVRILESAKPGSKEEDLALSFIELVKDASGVKNALCMFGRIHPDPKTQRLVMAILSNTPNTMLLNVKDYDNYKVETRVVIPIEQQDNKCKDFSCCDPK